MEEKKGNKNTSKIVSVVVVAVVIIVAIVISVVFLNKDNKGGDNNKNTTNGIVNSAEENTQINQNTQANQMNQSNTPDTFTVGNNTIVGPIDAPNNDIPLNSISTPSEGNVDQVQGSISTD